jgi:hypothetical protein
VSGVRSIEVLTPARNRVTLHLLTYHFGPASQSDARAIDLQQLYHSTLNSLAMATERDVEYNLMLLNAYVLLDTCD